MQNTTTASAPRALKLNVKRTCFIGFAFFGILLLWQVYDSWCPTFLTDICARRMYGLSSAALKASGENSKILNVQWIVGIIMACDNLAALILLPIFGSLSDRTHTAIGKRMPYILSGTLIAALAFPFIPNSVLISSGSGKAAKAPFRYFSIISDVSLTPFSAVKSARE